jgi:hypothetical protein
MNGWAGGNKKTFKMIKFGEILGTESYAIFSSSAWLCGFAALRPRGMLLFVCVLVCLLAGHDQVLCCLLFLSFFFLISPVLLLYIHIFIVLSL